MFNAGCDHLLSHQLGKLSAAQLNVRSNSNNLARSRNRLPDWSPDADQSAEANPTNEPKTNQTKPNQRERERERENGFLFCTFGKRPNGTRGSNAVRFRTGMFLVLIFFSFLFVGRCAIKIEPRPKRHFRSAPSLKNMEMK